MTNLNEYLEQQLDLASAKGRLRSLHSAMATAKSSEPIIETPDGQQLINFSSNDYLGLSRHPKLIQSATKATTEYGTGARSSRLIAGHAPTTAALEKTIAGYRETESALVFSSGYAANIGAISALMNQNDLILSDKLAHACLLDGAKLSGADMQRFAHNDVEHLEKLLFIKRKEFANCLIVTESIFSMDGDVAPIDDLLKLAKHYDCWLMVDDAHGAGFSKSLLAPVAAFENGIISGTLSKAIGALGGYVAGSDILKQYLVNHARSFMFSTALPPATIAAALAAYEVIDAQPELAGIAMQHAKHFTKAMHLPDAQSPIVPYIVGENVQATNATHTLLEHGFYVQAIRPPTVPPGTARLRITFTASHTKEQVEALARALKDIA